jgi:ABC-type lipoprotein release transport system permease subunit
VLLVLLVVLLLASALPVMRALRIQPADCLRSE